MNIELLTMVLKIVISTTLFFVWVVRYDNIITEFRKDFNYPAKRSYGYYQTFLCCNVVKHKLRTEQPRIKRYYNINGACNTYTHQSKEQL